MEHEVVPAKGDFFALVTTCQACEQIAYWRIGIGKWTHGNEEANDHVELEAAG